MSSTTNFIVNGLGDLSTIFTSWDGLSTQAPLTNYKYYDGTQFQDLSNDFQPLTTSPGSSYTVTGFKVYNYTPLWTTVTGTYDLGQVFVTVGSTWTQRSFPNSGSVNGFATAGNYWIVCTYAQVFVSNTGGQSWNTSSFVVYNNGNYYGIAGNSDGTLFCMSNSGYFFSSVNYGIDWTNRGNTPSGGVGYAMVYTNNTFVMLFLYSASCLASYSTDGITWSNSSGYNPGLPAEWFRLGTDGNGNLIATGYTTTAITAITAYSSDSGQTWTQGPDIINGGTNIYAITYGNGIWVALSGNAPYQSVISTVFPPVWYYHPQSRHYNDITFCSSQNLFYATTGNVGIFSSADGITWVQVLNNSTSPVSLKYNQSQNKFLGVSSYNPFCWTSI